jgi:hypothetical protein
MLRIAKNGFEEESGTPSVQSSSLTSLYFCLLLFGIAVQPQVMTILKSLRLLVEDIHGGGLYPRYLGNDKATDGKVEGERLLFEKFCCSVALPSQALQFYKCL